MNRIERFQDWQIRLKIILGVFGLLIVLLLIAFFVPIPVFPNYDFSVLYFSSQALLNGIDLYDYPTQLAFLQSTYDSEIEFHPYPYPPWYAIATILVAILPKIVSARAWFLINFSLIVLSVWLLTSHWSKRQQIIAFFAALLFFPVLGLLVVGQYSVPVLLGVALMIWSLRQESVWGTGFAFVLLTFKPHLGMFIAIAVFCWLIYQRKNPFVKRSIVFTLILAGFVFLIGFVADPAWPINYLNSLGMYQEISGVQSCGLCVSLPISVIELITGERNVFQAAIVSIFIGIILISVFAVRFRGSLANPFLLIVLAVFFTLLVDPYLLNYDFILLLVLFIILFEMNLPKPGKIVWLAAYFLPWLLLPLGRSGNIVLLVSTLLLLVLFLVFFNDDQSKHASSPWVFISP